MASRLVRIVVLSLLALLAASQAVAQPVHERIGRAGMIAYFSWQRCPAADAPAYDPCNPPPVDEKLSGEERATAGIKRAIAFISTGKMTDAAAALDKAVADDPKNVTALVLRVRVALAAANGSATKFANAAMLVAPNDPDLLATRAFINRENPALAFADINKSLSIEPNSVDALWIRSTILTMVKSFEEAERDLVKATALDPKHGHAIRSLAEVRARLGHPNPGATDVRPEARYDLTMIQIRAGERARAGDFAGAAQELTILLGEPGKPGALLPMTFDFTRLYLQRALALTRIGKAEEAKRDLDTIAKHGGIRAVLQMQIFLRSRGFDHVPLNGQRSANFDSAMETCFIRDNCAEVLRTPL